MAGGYIISFLYFVFSAAWLSSSSSHASLLLSSSFDAKRCRTRSRRDPLSSTKLGTGYTLLSSHTDTRMHAHTLNFLTLTQWLCLIWQSVCISSPSVQFLFVLPKTKLTFLSLYVELQEQQIYFIIILFVMACLSSFTAMMLCDYAYWSLRHFVRVQQQANISISIIFVLICIWMCGHSVHH